MGNSSSETELLGIVSPEAEMFVSEGKSSLTNLRKGGRVLMFLCGFVLCFTNFVISTLAKDESDEVAQTCKPSPQPQKGGLSVFI